MGIVFQLHMDNWVLYFSTTSSAASGLTGLIFIGLTISLPKIFVITKTHTPTRTFGSLSLLTNVLIVSNVCLIPNQPLPWLGIEIFFLTLVLWLVVTRLDIIVYRNVDSIYKRLYRRNILFSQLCILPFLSAAVLMIANSSKGTYFMVLGIIFSFVKSITDAWFLLVDINK